jgi:hypothetical protein
MKHCPVGGPAGTFGYLPASGFKIFWFSLIHGFALPFIFILILFDSRDVLAKPFKTKSELILREIRQICNEKMVDRGIREYYHHLGPQFPVGVPLD